jgi:hypothetical protein
MRAPLATHPDLRSPPSLQRGPPLMLLQLRLFLGCRLVEWRGPAGCCWWRSRIAVPQLTVSGGLACSAVAVPGLRLASADLLDEPSGSSGEDSLRLSQAELFELDGLPKHSWKSSLSCATPKSASFLRGLRHRMRGHDCGTVHLTRHGHVGRGTAAYLVSRPAPPNHVDGRPPLLACPFILEEVCTRRVRAADSACGDSEGGQRRTHQNGFRTRPSAWGERGISFMPRLMPRTGKRAPGHRLVGRDGAPHDL